ncbi:MAG: hypothetical protein Q7S56_02955 [Nanoarchaeota archaeon]|nr:hypothetical protein [Nanoarchaeota archaeon]
MMLQNMHPNIEIISEAISSERPYGRFNSEDEFQFIAFPNLFTCLQNLTLSEIDQQLETYDNRKEFFISKLKQLDTSEISYSNALRNYLNALKYTKSELSKLVGSNPSSISSALENH